MKHSALIVDDDPAIIAKLIPAGIAAGLEVVSARRAAEAIAIYPRLKPAVCLLDINLPGGDGFWALRRIRAQTSEGHIIMISSNSSPDSISKAASLGANDYLVKPLNLDELIARMTRVKEAISN